MQHLLTVKLQIPGCAYLGELKVMAVTTKDPLAYFRCSPTDVVVVKNVTVQVLNSLISLGDAILPFDSVNKN